MKIRKNIRESILNTLLEALSKKEIADVRNEVELELGHHFRTIAANAKTIEEYDEIEKKYMAQVESEVRRRVQHLSSQSTRGHETRTKIKDKTKWSEVYDDKDSDISNTSLAAIDNNSLSTFYDESEQGAIDVTDGNNSSLTDMNRRNFLKNSAIGTVGAAFAAKTGITLSDGGSGSSRLFDNALRLAKNIHINIDPCGVITHGELQQIGSHVSNVLDGLDIMTPTEFSQIISAIFENVIDDKMDILGTSDDISRQINGMIDFDAISYYDTIYANLPEFSGITLTESFFGVMYGGWGETMFAPVGREDLFSKRHEDFVDEEGWDVYESIMSDRNFFDTPFTINHGALTSLPELIAERFTGLTRDALLNHSEIVEEYWGNDTDRRGVSIGDYEQKMNITIIDSTSHPSIGNNALTGKIPKNNILGIK